MGNELIIALAFHDSIFLLFVDLEFEDFVFLKILFFLAFQPLFLVLQIVDGFLKLIVVLLKSLRVVSYSLI